MGFKRDLNISVGSVWDGIGGVLWAGTGGLFCTGIISGERGNKRKLLHMLMKCGIRDPNVMWCERRTQLDN